MAKTAAMIKRDAQTRNPGEMKRAMKGRMWVTDCCSGELRAEQEGERVNGEGMGKSELRCGAKTRRNELQEEKEHEESRLTNDRGSNNAKSTSLAVK